MCCVVFKCVYCVPNVILLKKSTCRNHVTYQLQLVFKEPAEENWRGVQTSQLSRWSYRKQIEDLLWTKNQNKRWSKRSPPKESQR